MYVNEFNELRKRTYLQLQILSLSGINRNEGTLYVGNMIPGVTLESIKDHPTAAYSKAVEELVNERVSSKSESITVHAYLWKFLPRKACVLICVHLTCFFVSCSPGFKWDRSASYREILQAQRSNKWDWNAHVHRWIVWRCNIQVPSPRIGKGIVLNYNICGNALWLHKLLSE